MFRDRVFPVNRWLEPLFALAIAVALGWVFFYLYRFDQLPQPFFYVPEDTYMDWFNTAFWAHNFGAYDSWGTIYPPLSFVILRVLTDGSCYISEGYSTRACDWWGALTLHLIYIANCILVTKTFLKIDRNTAVPRAFALCAGLPMLFALERGNILLLCFTAVLLAYGPLVRSARLRWLAAAFAVNFKVYLIGTLFAQLLRRRWRWFEGAMITTIAVYLVTFAILGEGTPGQIYKNISDFAGLWEAATPLDLWYAVTYRPLISLLHGPFPTTTAIGSYWVDVLIVALPAAIYATQAAILVAAFAAWLRPAVVPLYRLVFLSIAMALVTSEAGGYTQMFLFLFVFMEPWRGLGRKIAIVLTYILSIPMDIPIINVPATARPGFLGFREIIAEFSVGIGPFIRPGLLIIVVVALSAVTIREVWTHIKQNGWRERYRYAPSCAADDSRAAPTAA